jgi:hypothetical protein
MHIFLIFVFILEQLDKTNYLPSTVAKRSNQLIEHLPNNKFSAWTDGQASSSNPQALRNSLPCRAFRFTIYYYSKIIIIKDVVMWVTRRVIHISTFQRGFPKGEIYKHEKLWITLIKKEWGELTCRLGL